MASIGKSVGTSVRQGTRNKRPQTFSTYYGLPLNLPGSPVIYPSRKAYPTNIAIDAVITVSAGAEYSLDGTTWTSDAGEWGTSKFIMVRGPAHEDYGSAKIHTVTIGLLELEFTLWTREEWLGYEDWDGLEDWPILLP